MVSEDEARAAVGEAAATLLEDAAVVAALRTDAAVAVGRRCPTVPVACDAGDSAATTMCNLLRRLRVWRFAATIAAIDAAAAAAAAAIDACDDDASALPATVTVRTKGKGKKKKGKGTKVRQPRRVALLGQEAASAWTRLRCSDAMHWINTPTSPAETAEIIAETADTVVLEWGCAATKGASKQLQNRRNNEKPSSPLDDQPRVIEDVIVVPPDDARDAAAPAIFVLLDGHGGRDCAVWFAARLQSAIKTAIESATAGAVNAADVESVLSSDPARITRAIRAAIRKLDDDFVRLRSALSLSAPDAMDVPDDGATMTALVALPSTLITINIGDSRTAIFQRSRPPFTTTDHDLTHRARLSQIIAAGAQIRPARNAQPWTPTSTSSIPPHTARVYRPPTWRTDLFEPPIKSMAMLDSLGDVAFKLPPRLFPCDADVVVHPMTDDAVVVLASDGVWEHVASVDALGKCLWNAIDARAIASPVGATSHTQLLQQQQQGTAGTPRRSRRAASGVVAGGDGGDDALDPIGTDEGLAGLAAGIVGKSLRGAAGVFASNATQQRTLFVADDASAIVVLVRKRRPASPPPATLLVAASSLLSNNSCADESDVVLLRSQDTVIEASPLDPQDDDEDFFIVTDTLLCERPSNGSDNNHDDDDNDGEFIKVVETMTPPPAESIVPDSCPSPPPPLQVLVATSPPRRTIIDTDEKDPHHLPIADNNTDRGPLDTSNENIRHARLTSAAMLLATSPSRRKRSDDDADHGSRRMRRGSGGTGGGANAAVVLVPETPPPPLAKVTGLSKKRTM